MSEPFSFAAPVSVDPGVAAGYMRHHVPIPPDVAEALAGARRLAGSLDGVTFSRVLQTTTDGEPCVRFGEGWLRGNGFVVDQVVDVVLGGDPDPDHVPVPDELAEALAKDPRAGWAWEAATPGKRRTLTFPVRTAKREQTRRRRADAVVAQLLAELEEAL